jgi:hypothetical protein
MGRASGRLLTKLIVLAAIGAVVVGIYRVEQKWTTAPEPGVVYVNPGFSSPSPASPAP